LKRPIKVGISEIKWSTLKQEQGNIKYKFLESVSKFGQGAGVFCFWKVGILELQSCWAAKGLKYVYCHRDNCLNQFRFFKSGGKRNVRDVTIVYNTV
jgi:hypothetical protein